MLIGSRVIATSPNTEQLLDVPQLLWGIIKPSKQLRKALAHERNEGAKNYLEHLRPSKATSYSLSKATKTLKRLRT